MAESSSQRPPGPRSDIVEPSFSIGEAANMLNVSPNTLRGWHTRHGFGPDFVSAGGHRRYKTSVVQTLTGLLAEGYDARTAIEVLQSGVDTSFYQVITALEHLQGQDADQRVEASLPIRSVNNLALHLILPATRTILKNHGVRSSQWDYASRWGIGWLNRLDRLSSPTRPQGVWIGEATHSPTNPDSLEIAAFALFCKRAGFQVLSLSVNAPDNLDKAAKSVSPDRIILAGHDAELETMGEWAYHVRQATERRIHDVFLGSSHANMNDHSAPIRRLPKLPELAAEAVTTALLAT